MEVRKHEGQSDVAYLYETRQGSRILVEIYEMGDLEPETDEEDE